MNRLEELGRRFQVPPAGLEALRAMQIDYGQGWLFGRPCEAWPQEAVAAPEPCRPVAVSGRLERDLERACTASDASEAIGGGRTQALPLFRSTLQRAQRGTENLRNSAALDLELAGELDEGAHGQAFSHLVCGQGLAGEMGGAFGGGCAHG